MASRTVLYILIFINCYILARLSVSDNSKDDIRDIARDMFLAASLNIATLGGLLLLS